MLFPVKPFLSQKFTVSMATKGTSLSSSANNCMFKVTTNQLHGWLLGNSITTITVCTDMYSHIFHTFADYSTDVQLGMGPVTAVPVQHSVVAVGGAS